ncbi:hypothetical protein [Dokdonella sp.]|uniref:hypothetical protein n=1 Tax=Dokdonella sp. TaxID=2291710 RepID=UPI00352903DA
MKLPAIASTCGLFLLAGAANAGTPPELLDYQGGYSILGNMLGVAALGVGDLDGDGNNEVVVSGTTVTFGGPGLLSVLRSDAGNPDGYSQVAFTEAYAAGIKTAALLDLNGDGAEEVVVGLGDGSVRVLEGTSLVPRSETASVSGNIGQFALSDADNNGSLDLVVLSSGAITLLDPLTLQARGSIAQGASRMAIGNVDNDALVEVVLSSGKVLRLTRSGSTLVSQTVWTYPAGAFGIQVGLVDIDNDGKLELIAESDWDYLTAFDVDLQSPKWQINSLGDLDAMSFADVNGDDVPDALIGSGQWGDESAIDLTTRQVIWSVSNPNSGTGRVIVGDVDNDGVGELLWTGGHNSTGPDNLYVYSLPALTPKWMTLHTDGPFSAVAVKPALGSAGAKIAFASFESESGYDDGIVWQWNASTLAPLTRTEPGTFEGFAWTGIHALAYGAPGIAGEQALLVGTDRLYDGAIYGLDEDTSTVMYQRLYDEGSPINALVAADLDGDGNGEIVSGSYGAHTGSPGRYVMVTDEATGAELWRSINLSSTFGGVIDIAVGRLDGDSIKDIAAIAGNGSGGYLFQFDGASHVQWQSSDASYTAVATFDVLGDSRDETVVGTSAGAVLVLDGVTHAVVGNLQVGSGAVAAVRVFHESQTTAVRIAVLVDEQLRVFDLQSGTLLAISPHMVRQTRALEVIDANGDNQMDIFVGGESAFRAYRLHNDLIFRDGFG